MLFDRSSNRSTNVYGPDAHDFSKEQKVRKVLVAPDLNTNIWISVDNSEVGKGKGYGFALHWHDPVFSMKKELELIPEDSLHRRTIDATSPDHDPLPPDTLPDLRPKMRLRRIQCLGTGNSGAVMKAANVDTGDVYAVKVVHNSDRPERTLREAKTLTEISHPHIIKVHYAQWNDEDQLEVIMDLHDGCVDTLVNQGGLYRKVELILDLQRQMLEALDYLSVLGLVHGDIKPGNILYSVRPSGRYNFILSDFNVSHSNDEAAVSLGTEPFIAPELRRDQQTGQTSKADIWSLAVTILYVGSPVFRRKIRREEDVMEAIEAALEDSHFTHLRPMLKMDPAEQSTLAGPSLEPLLFKTCTDLLRLIATLLLGASFLDFSLLRLSRDLLRLKLSVFGGVLFLEFTLLRVSTYLGSRQYDSDNPLRLVVMVLLDALAHL
ncbi:Serine/threonine-protein kinase ppk11 [Lasiodiplodia hormozganensis]|uniref:Serine/threonine-protein kinase ppk11 n=1 Tax=Lasiodiplodia hormozganensis TaxID=869390 RepID=A0AA39W4W4_9PEZI|nr:Serine/threonine-protein kinase ppk11 [Lasiodiplodia hormozganensis]